MSWWYFTDKSIIWIDGVFNRIAEMRGCVSLRTHVWYIYHTNQQNVGKYTIHGSSPFLGATSLRSPCLDGRTTVATEKIPMVLWCNGALSSFFLCFCVWGIIQPSSVGIISLFERNPYESSRIAWGNLTCFWWFNWRVRFCLLLIWNINWDERSICVNESHHSLAWEFTTDGLIWWQLTQKKSCNKQPHLFGIKLPMLKQISRSLAETRMIRIWCYCEAWTSKSVWKWVPNTFFGTWNRAYSPM